MANRLYPLGANNILKAQVDFESGSLSAVLLTALRAAALAVFIVRGVWAQEARDIVVPEPESEEGNG